MQIEKLVVIFRKKIRTGSSFVLKNKPALLPIKHFLKVF